MRTAGIDLSATAQGTAVVAIDWSAAEGGARGHAQLVCDSADGSAGTEAVLDALEDGDKVGIDCPFGWPSSFVAAIAAHGCRGRGRRGPSRRTAASCGCGPPTATSPNITA